MSLVKIDDREMLIMIGGFSNETKQNIAWEYEFDKNWRKMNVTGFEPVAIFGHSTVFHAPTQVLYVFGGYQMVKGKIQVSRRLYSLKHEKEKQLWRWSK